MENKKPMSAKAYLSQAMFIDQRINCKLEQVARLRESVVYVSAKLDGMPRSHSANHQAMADSLVKIVDFEREINRDIDRLVDLKREIRAAIGMLCSAEEQLVLELRYLCYKTWEEIAEDLRYSLPSIYRIHGLALKKIVVPGKVDSVCE